jgi:hypothetical protein
MLLILQSRTSRDRQGIRQLSSDEKSLKCRLKRNGDGFRRDSCRYICMGLILIGDYQTLEIELAALSRSCKYLYSIEYELGITFIIMANLLGGLTQKRQWCGCRTAITNMVQPQKTWRNLYAITEIGTEALRSWPQAIILRLFKKGTYVSPYHQEPEAWVSSEEKFSCILGGGRSYFLLQKFDTLQNRGFSGR